MLFFNIKGANVPKDYTTQCPMDKAPLAFYLSSLTSSRYGSISSCSPDDLATARLAR